MPLGRDEPGLLLHEQGLVVPRFEERLLVRGARLELDPTAREVLGEPDNRVGPALVQQLGPKTCLELDEPNGPLLGVAGLPTDTAEEKIDPRCEVALLARGQEVVVVLGPVLLEVGGEIEQWLRQRSSKHQHHRDEKTTNPPVAVEKGVNRLELVMSDSQLDQQRHVGLMEESLQVGECVAHCVGRGRDEDSILERSSADPDGGLSEVAGTSMLASNPRQQQPMHLAHQPHRHREPFGGASETVLHRHHIVPNLLCVVSILPTRHLAGLVAEQLGHVGFRTFDPRTQNGLQTKMRANQEVGIGKKPAHSTKAINCAGCLVQQLHRVLRQVETPRYRIRVERPVSLESSSH